MTATIEEPAVTPEQKKSILILSFGTFLEYFDLSLYIHMATLLNDLFFPQTNPMTTQLLTATAFCSTYVLRPVGGYIIGKIGDIRGRRPTILITTFAMSIACLIMAGTPTYAEIGITATIMIIVARVLQGFSSLGEVMGAQIYMTETLKVPYRCVASGMVVWAGWTGGTFALIITSFVLSTGLNWRLAFAIGAVIAVVGIFARRKLRETPAFTDHKKDIADKVKKNNQKPETIKNTSFEDEKINKKTILAFAFTELHGSICFYVAIVYLSDFMKRTLGLMPAQVATHNLKVMIAMVIGVLAIACFAKKFHPVKIAILMAIAFIIVLPFIPYWLDNVSGLFSLFCLQVAIYSLTFSTGGTLDAIQYKYFPVSKRFTTVATTYGIASPLGFAIAAYGLIPLTHYFGYYALWIVFTPAVIGYVWALYYFRKLEIERGLYYDYPCDAKPLYEDTANNGKDFKYVLNPEYDPYIRKCKFSRQLLNELEKLNKKATKKVNLKLVQKAIVFAKKWHDKQVRKTGEPFYVHPLTVARLTSKYYFKTDVLVACILHDTVEDDKTRQCTVELIEKEFNSRIANMVDGLTRIRCEDGQEKKLSLEETLIKLHEEKDYEALFMKCIDREHNLSTIEGMKPDKQRQIAIETTTILLPAITNICEKLGVDDYRKYELENKIFDLTHKVLGNDKKDKKE